LQAAWLTREYMTQPHFFEAFGCGLTEMAITSCVHGTLAFFYGRMTIKF